MFRTCRIATREYGIRCVSVAMAAFICNTSNVYCETKKEPKLKILVIGSGLTGSLTALRIQQRLNKPECLDIVVAERATYPAGRFGATGTHHNIVADIGAQVLSTVNPKDYRAANEGHGIAFEDIQLADSIVQSLLSQNLLLLARDTALAETEERMVFEGLWKHYFAIKGGMTQILRFLLNEARVQPVFGLRIDSLHVEEDNSINVHGVLRDQGQNHSPIANKPFKEKFDFVIVCIPAPDAMKIKGVATNLAPQSRYVLEHVRYDKRICEAHFFSDQLSPYLAEAMGDRVEQNVEDFNNGIEYVAWQNPKRSLNKVDDEFCSIVVHGQTNLQSESLSLESVDATISQLTGLSKEEVASFRIKTKSICWDASQMITPMEAIIGDPPTRWQCLQNGRLILAGDYMTQSSFLGCVATADAAARAVEEAYKQY